MYANYYVKVIILTSCHNDEILISDLWLFK